MSGYHYVRPYRRKDGTLVRGHMARNPAPHIGAGAVLLVVALLVILGSVAHAHAGGINQHGKDGTAQHSAVTSTKAPYPRVARLGRESRSHSHRTPRRVGSALQGRTPDACAADAAARSAVALI